jgi:DNA-binding response OmpR family regulator
LEQSNSSDVRILIAVENPMVRTGVHNSLRDAGYREMTQITVFDQIELLQKESYDLIFLSSHMGDRSFIPIVSAIRDGKHGHHAFPVMVLLLSDGDRASVSQAISCGADDVLLLPVSAGQIISRTAQLAGRRKPFILTRDYTGPDRRREQRPGTTPALQLVDAPNPLKAKIDGVSDFDLKLQIESAGRKLNSLKMENYARQIEWIIRAIGEMFHTKAFDADKLEGHAAALRLMAHDLPSRIGSRMNKRVASLLGDVISCADHIRRDGLSLSASDLELISTACLALGSEISKLGDSVENLQVA